MNDVPWFDDLVLEVLWFTLYIAPQKFQHQVEASGWPQRQYRKR